MSKTYLLAAAVATAAATSYTNAAQIADINGTKISFGGYIKVEGTFNRPDSDAANDAEASFIGQARQSRFNLKTEREVEGHKVKTFIEGDFFGNSYQASSTSSYFRMRHAYLAVDNLTVGQTWSGQFFNSALFDVKIINFWGLGSGGRYHCWHGCDCPSPTGDSLHHQGVPLYSARSDLSESFLPGYGSWLH